MTAGASLARPAFVLWLALYVAAAAVRPGALFELALVGIAGAVMLAAATQASNLTPAELAAAALAFSLPLLNTWVARVYDEALERGSPLLAAALAVPAVLAVAALAWGDRRSLRQAPTLLKASAAAAALAAVASAALSDDRLAALTDSWWQVWLPILVGAAALSAVRTAAAGWLVLDAVVLAALVPCLVGVAAYVSSFGVPLSVDTLVVVKRELSRQFLFQEVTFGNVGHLADFALLVAPLAIVSAVQARSPLLRAACTTAALVTLVALVLTQSRSAIAVATLGLSFLALLLWHTSKRAAICSLAVAVAFAATLVSTVVSAPPQRPSPGVEAALPADQSAAFRSSAVRRGLEVAARHLPFGVGAGRYVVYDPVHTSTHSLPIQILAELGVLGLLALLCLIAVFVRAVAMLPRGKQDDGGLLVLGASAGALTFLTHGLIAGAPLAFGNVSTWACLLALYAALAGRYRLG